MDHLIIESGDYRFTARLEHALAPRTCAQFVAQLPYAERIIHVRWSGEACWIPLGELETGLPFENATSYPAPGPLLYYPGGYSETEILLPYGPTRFASKLGQLAGNHFLTIVDNLEALAELGRSTLQKGAQDIIFRLPAQDIPHDV